MHFEKGVRARPRSKTPGAVRAPRCTPISPRITGDQSGNHLQASFRGRAGSDLNVVLALQVQLGRWKPPIRAAPCPNLCARGFLRILTGSWDMGWSWPVYPQVLQMFALSGRRMDVNWRRVFLHRPTHCPVAGPTRSAGCGMPSMRAPSTAALSSRPQGARPPTCGSL